MKILLQLCAGLIFFSIGFAPCEAQGRDVTVYFKDNREATGELLIVRDTMLAILKAEVANKRDIVNYPEKVEFAFINDIDRILLHEKEVKGAEKGLLFGAVLFGGYGLAEMAASSSNYPYPGGSTVDEMDVLGNAALGAATGLVIGWLVAIARSEDAEIVRPTAMQSLLEMQDYARFDDREPKYIREFIDNLLKAQK